MVVAIVMWRGLLLNPSAARQGARAALASSDPADDVGAGDDAGERFAVHHGDALDLVLGHGGGDMLERVVARDADRLFGHDVFDSLPSLADEVGLADDAGELASAVEDG